MIKPGHALALTSSHSIKSFGSLQAAVAWAEFDADLYELLKSEESRELLRITLLHTYFPAASEGFLHPIRNYLQQLEEAILQEPAEAYQAKILEFQKQLSREAVPGLPSA